MTGPYESSTPARYSLGVGQTGLQITKQVFHLRDASAHADEHALSYRFIVTAASPFPKENAWFRRRRVRKVRVLLVRPDNAVPIRPSDGAVAGSRADVRRGRWGRPRATPIRHRDRTTGRSDHGSPATALQNVCLVSGRIATQLNAWGIDFSTFRGNGDRHAMPVFDGVFALPEHKRPRDKDLRSPCRRPAGLACGEAGRDSRRIKDGCAREVLVVDGCLHIGQDQWFSFGVDGILRKPGLVCGRDSTTAFKW